MAERGERVTMTGSSAQDGRCTISAVGRRLALSFVTLLIVVLNLAGAAQGSFGGAQGWALPKKGVLIRQGLLRQALDQVFTVSAPVKVECRGLHPVALTKGGRGFLQIRCSTSLNIKDFIYHLDSRGRIYVTRSPKR
jgi:hypothetical protein